MIIDIRFRSHAIFSHRVNSVHGYTWIDRIPTKMAISPATFRDKFQSFRYLYGSSSTLLRKK